MKNSRFFAFLTALFISSLFLSCSSIFESRQGTITVNLPQNNSRAAYEASEIDAFRVEIFQYKNNIPVWTEDFPGTTSSFTSSPLYDGKYVVVIKALKINEDSSTGIIGEGNSGRNKPVELINGKADPVSVIIRMFDILSDPVDYPVTTNVLYVKATGDDSNDGLSAEAPLKTFAKATELAYNNPSTIDTIFIIGTLDNISENNGAAASGDGKGKSTFCLNYELGTETKHFKIIGNKDNHAVLKATGAGTDSAAESSRRVLFVNKQCYVDIEYIDFTGAGNVSGSGAGIYVNPDLTIHLNLTGCKIYGNTVVTEQHGAGIYMSGNNVMNIYDTEIFDNHISLPEGSSAQKGGAAILVGGQLTIHSGSIHDNSITGSAGSMGGGIYVMNGTCTMNGGSFSKNTASYGGAIFNQATFIYNGGYIADDNVGFAERSDGDMNSNAICSTTNIESLSDYLDVIHGKYVCNTAIGEPEE